MNNSFDLIGLQKGLKLFTNVQINSFRCTHCLCTMETICIRNSIKIPTILYRFFMYMALAFSYLFTSFVSRFLWVFYLSHHVGSLIWHTTFTKSQGGGFTCYVELWENEKPSFDSEYTTSNFLSLTSLLLASCLRKHAHWFWHFLSGQDILTYSSCLQAPTRDVRSTNSGWLQTG